MTDTQNTPESRDPEQDAGRPVDDGFDSPDPVADQAPTTPARDRANAPDNQQPEVAEFGQRAVKPGDPDNEDRADRTDGGARTVKPDTDES